MERDLRAMEGGEAVRALRAMILEDDDELLEAADGRGALDVVQSRQVGLVLLDIRLPQMDGFAGLERIRGGRDEARRLRWTAPRPCWWSGTSGRCAI